MSLTRAAIIKRALREVGSRDLVKEIRRYFNTAKRDRGFKWVYGMPTLTAHLLPTWQTKTFQQLAREMESAR